MSNYSRSLELNGNRDSAFEEQVIDDYYVSLQNGDIELKNRVDKPRKQKSAEHILDQLKKDMNSDLDKIAAQIKENVKPNTANISDSVQQSMWNISVF